MSKSEKRRITARRLLSYLDGGEEQIAENDVADLKRIFRHWCHSTYQGLPLGSAAGNLWTAFLKRVSKA